MSDSQVVLQRKLASAGDLKSVVRTMKAMAAASITQYETALQSLDAYYATVRSGLSVCLRAEAKSVAHADRAGSTCVVVFGSDQGLVGQFNENMLQFVRSSLSDWPRRHIIWPVGQRLRASLEQDSAAAPYFSLPAGISVVGELVAALLIEIEAQRARGELSEVLLFYHQLQTNASSTPTLQRLLPLDQSWRAELLASPWPGQNVPALLNASALSLRACVSEYLYVSLFRACVASLASENASRLSAMQRAEKNIEELSRDLTRELQQLRQSSIDEELFDLIAGFEALNHR
ncbi:MULTISPECIES: F0F1 ATP synthase subunit gamma [unclassified Undibacterium]|uniref:F0F1 ATP synthase subunit gamma n=1 Tax=unclassified Undibacterium TaxID=2630295 RepID=UPI002AC9A109|nr:MULTISPECIES: F0F1 ATP synthase subunit gamma [unclassified Undibacterium]MEB0140638.1 F0F1 ATP synthase subunit gamma [Undibacterium sp. CCC2.1]MEB0173667.1 F0F1 ATP synthase subunit gamma [Undibacterium sp. CCC1.1]MEB0177651.1 F0F1 ATP synthase subunit gamma [Undibacterium sp. CCC3.4]MEB0216832.1 F0F1 ATP synthase subunit gamma [Undibacterium sp. 5I2]WPX41924.1 F0F1 ATP synthase subunit gamma [Undibacterium sp. CCC3.4]